MVKVKVLQEFFFSQVLGKPIYDANNIKIGRLMDLAVQWVGIAPMVTGIKYAKGVQNHIDIEQIDRWNEEGIILKGTLDAGKLLQLQDDEIYVSKWLLDKQIIDLNGSRLVRVNDIKLSWVNHRHTSDILLVAVDIGIRGIFRRLGMEFFVKNRKNKFVGWEYIKPLENKTANLRLSQETDKLKQLHPGEIADIIEELDHQERNGFLDGLDNQTVAVALAEVDEETRLDIIEKMDSSRASDILEEMAPDEAADILTELNEEKSSELLNLMEPEEAQEVKGLMDYPEETAGALMTTEYIAFSSNMTAEETINRLRKIAPAAETIYYLYVLDQFKNLKGVISLRDLIIAKPDSKLGEFMRTRVASLNHMDNHERVRDIITKYNLLAVPVINEEGIMLGIITVDDVLETVLPDRSNVDTFSHFMLPRKPGRGWKE